MSNFISQSAKIEQQLFPHKKVALGDLRQIDGPLFDLNGMDLVFEPSVIESLNRQIGTSRAQLNMVRNASGDVGQVNFRNFLSDANSLANNKDVVIIASPETRHIVNILIPKQEFIPPQQFFDFAQLFMEDASYEFEKMDVRSNGLFDIMIYMQSRTPTIQQFAPGEDTITDGAYLHWTGDEIELGNFYTRLVCTNGAVATVKKQQTKLHSFNPSEVHRMIELAKSRQLPKIGFQTYEEKALEAMNTTCSLFELQSISRELTGHRTNMSAETVDSFLPTRKYENYFSTRGVDIKKQAKLVKTDLNVWTVFNVLTEFATHTDLLAHDDGARSIILHTANRFLQAERDIKHYIEYE